MEDRYSPLARIVFDFQPVLPKQSELCFKTLKINSTPQNRFNIIIAGGSAYEPCTHHLQKIALLNRGFFETNIYINESTFSGTPQLIKELMAFGATEQNHIGAIRLYGDLDITTTPQHSSKNK
ncbi:MAG TPA: hypothetical protein PKE30_14445 [Niabella sp.]|nr:hypothetical protein [Niabella sp.]